MDSLLNKNKIWGKANNVYNIINLRHACLGVFLYLYIQVVIGVWANVGADRNVDASLARSKIRRSLWEVNAFFTSKDFVKADDWLTLTY
ncbi:hypothetical protein ES703_125885 [subsurface metagenome]